MSPVTKISRVLVGVAFDDASASALKMADVIVPSMAADVGAHARFGAIVQVLNECVHPVLFVPSADGIFERSSS